jgi:hypothetical protein
MSPLHSGAATLPKGFRYHHEDFPEPKTPEPFCASDDIQPPSPPRPRFKLKRRNVSQLAAPTQHFLASVAAADVPIPSIEEPAEVAIADEEMMDTAYPAAYQLRDLEDIVIGQKIRGRTFSPPKTPAPGAVPSLSPRRYPNWSIDSAFSSGDDSSPECESSRPSTSRSTQTSASLFSRFSLVSEDLHCMSPDDEGLEGMSTASSAKVSNDILSSKAKGKLRKAPWTKPMSQHLWSTYLVYLQDPKVTPFRTGKSCIPPHGVCLRVAREAKRSWKGSKPYAKSVAATDDKSGSNTPTAETSGAFIQWPHTCAATRAHLRELCRVKASSSAVRSNKYLSHSPTPFGRTVTRYWNRRSTPGRSPSVFSGQDMAMSLTMSTSETMQPQGPLAQLTSSAPEPAEETPPMNGSEQPATRLMLDAPSMDRRRLGSPFIARSYGPSSSGALAAALSLTGPGPFRQTHTVGPRRSLQSPVRLTRSRSNTQKRRTRPLSNELRKCKRPSLASDLWTDPSAADQAVEDAPPVMPAVEFSSTSSSHHDELFVPRTNMEELLPAQPLLQAAQTQSFVVSASTLAPPEEAPPRLGSPFSGSSASFSFPNRFSQPDNLGFGAIRRPFATIQMQQPTEGTAAAARPNLATRLAYIDQRLRELRNRDQTRRRSESPF